MPQIQRAIAFCLIGLFMLAPLAIFFVPLEAAGLNLQMDTNLRFSHASFWGEDSDDSSGYSVAGAGDVNGDGYDDILIGAYTDEEGGGYGAGQTYLIFGKASGWAMDTNLSSASASFGGEDSDDYSGNSVAGAGDVNRDGYDDILIGAPNDEEGGVSAGQTYLIFGKASGWAMDTPLSLASASFRGEDSNDLGGSSVAGAGDVNRDGYDDILIGAYLDEEGGVSAGQTYLIFGKASGWAMDTSLSLASASFRGEDSNDDSGYSVAGAGDVNGDGYDDILIGAYTDEEGGTSAGQTYLIFGKASGWAMDTSLSSASASFRGEDSYDFSGSSVEGAGDVNGDGYDDILIGAYLDEEGGSNAGQTYLIMPFARPPPPKNPSAAIAQTTKQITVNWDKPDFWNEPITGYRVLRSCDGSNFQDIAFRGPDDRSYIDTNITVGRTYYYLIVTVDGDEALSPRIATVGLACDYDTDGDGIGNIADTDDDGDGVVDGQDAFPLNSAETLDTDWDGMGNNADTDDDNDGILDTNDPEPRNPQNALQYHLNYLNTTLQNVQSDMDSAGALLTTMNGNINTLSGNLNTMNASLTGLINNIDSDISTLSTQVRGDMSALSSQVKSDLIGMNASLATGLADVRNLVSDVSADLSAMDAYLASMNESLVKNLADMEARLAADIMALDVALKAVNASLHAELLAMSSELDAFRTEMLENLSAILSELDKNDQAQTENYNRLLGLMNAINSTSLADLKGQIATLQCRTDTMGLNLSNRIEDFRAQSVTRLDNISKLMLSVDDIKSLTTEMKSVQTGMNAVKDEQETTSKSVAGLAPPAWGSMVLVIVVLLVTVLILLASRRKGGQQNAPAVPATPVKTVPPPDDKE
jgi:hypothetical protein